MNWFNCSERNRGVVVYRNVLFKARKTLLQADRFGDQYSIFYEFLELEQANGRTIFLARSSIMKFCEHGVTPDADDVSPAEGTPGI